MKWRLTFDDPVTYAIEPGPRRALHCSDFRGTDNDQAVGGVWREPVTGLLMLRPSVLTPGFAGGFRDLSQWTKNANFWQNAKRVTDANGGSAPLLTSVQPQGQSSNLMAILVNVAISAIEAVDSLDILLWALQSNFMLGADAGFCLHYHGLTDEMFRYENWFTVHWDNISVNISQTGLCRIYLYNRADLTQAPVLVEQFEFAGPGDLLGSYGSFYLQPIPGYGLLFHHSRRTPKMDVLSSTANTGAAHGHLIKWPVHYDGGVPLLFEPSVVTIGINPNLPYLLGYQDVTFPAAGVFTDSAFDLGFPPSTAPAGVAVTHVITALSEGNAPTTTALASLRTADNSDAWAPGQRQGRVQMELATTNSSYTPFVNGYGVGWNPVTATRGTTPTLPSKLLRLEISEDEWAHFEGTAEVLMETAAQRQIAERGDATWLLEYSADWGATWTVMNGGLATFSDLEEVITSGRAFYKCRVALGDNWQRFREVFDMLDTAFDSESLVDAFNGVLLGNGFNPLVSYPPDLPAITLPPVGVGQTWQISPREGESSEQILETFLLFCRRQDVEYRLRYDWPSQGWLIEYKPGSAGTPVPPVWTLTAFSEEHNPAFGVARYSARRPVPSPPEANRTYVYGTTSNVPGAERVVSAPLTNYDSLTNPNSPDYLGRVKIVGFKAVGITDITEIDKMNRRVFEAVAHRRLQDTVETQDFVPGLVPNTPVNIRSLDATGSRTTLYGTWLKKRTVVVENEDQETVTYTLDTNWVGELQQ